MRLPIALAAIAALSACAANSANDAHPCTSTTRAATCSGTFACTVTTIGVSETCNAATQICAVSGNTIGCPSIAGSGSAGSASCPSEQDALELAGCAVPANAMCEGDSATGITVVCAD